MKLKKEHPVYALLIIVLLAVVANILLEIFPKSSAPKMFMVSVVGIGGSLMFWISAGIRSKNKQYGHIALGMAIFLKISSFAYVWYGSGRVFYLLGKLEYQIFNDYTFMLMTVGHLLILFCDMFIFFYSDPEDETAKRIEEIRKQANAWETQSNADEDERKAAESRANLFEVRMNEAENKLKANEVILSEYENKLNACEGKAKSFEHMQPVIESFINTPFLDGNTWRYISSDTMKAYTFGRGKDEIKVNGKAIKKPKK